MGPEPPPPLPSDANQYMKDVVKHELAADETDHSHWRYKIHREDERGSQDRDVIDTKDGQLARTLLINGKPLTADQRAADEARMKKLVDDPAERAKREKRAKDDSDKLTMMFKAIPDAFIFKYEGEENGQVRLTFFFFLYYEAPTRKHEDTAEGKRANVPMVSDVPAGFQPKQHCRPFPTTGRPARWSDHHARDENRLGAAFASR